MLNHDSVILDSNPSLFEVPHTTRFISCHLGVLACLVPFNVEGQDLYHVLTKAIKDVNSMKESLECPCTRSQGLIMMQ